LPSHASHTTQRSAGGAPIDGGGAASGAQAGGPCGARALADAVADAAAVDGAALDEDAMPGAPGRRLPVRLGGVSDARPVPPGVPPLSVPRLEFPPSCSRVPTGWRVFERLDVPSGRWK
jgi:hypothetical protein